MQTIVYHSKARKTMCGMGTFCLIGMISFQLTMQNGEIKISYRSSEVTTEWLIKNPVSIGILTKAVPGFDFPLEYTWFFIAISDGWGAGMLVFPYGTAGNNLVIGQYDRGAKNWRWITK